ncbi:hypothetical protein [Chitinophaga qingshengii]|uniref:Uncharacterized protein n=1 Tax=Chitinophaga qingshengii TaxID=1569794 RepID=A0ABR7TK79_9BACT|nr:hypothetical protein [Chitinophaga qingshengii]MBC9930893.1 hypothetical protein [Chitinophaga qingshengii]
MNHYHYIHLSGYRKDTWPFIPLLKLLLEYKKMPFSEARIIVDTIWAGGTAEVEFTDLNIAWEFLEKADEAGVNCNVSNTTSNNALSNQHKKGFSLKAEAFFMILVNLFPDSIQCLHLFL